MKDLHHGKYAPVYLFDGEESYYIDVLTDYIEEHALDESGKAFDQVVLYGKDVDIKIVRDEINRYPMLGDRRVVILKEAQNIKDYEPLLPYLKEPIPGNVLVIAHKYKKMDGKRAVTKYLRTHHVYVESKPIYDNQLPEWIDDYTKTKGRHIDPKAAILMAEFVGTDLSRLSNELDKLMQLVPARANITPDDVEKNIGISKEYNNFELIDALARKDVLKANKIIKYFAQNPKANPPVVTTTVLYSFFSRLLIAHNVTEKTPQAMAAALKMAPFQTRNHLIAIKNYSIQKNARIIGYLREFDMRLKGMNNVNTTDYDLLRELVFKILH